MTSEKLQVRRVLKTARCPTRGSREAAGFDLYAAEGGVIGAKTKGVVDLGIQVAVPQGYYGQVAPRSGLALNKSIMVMAGVIDSDYRGMLRVILYNNGEEPFVYEAGDRIAQMILIKISLCDVDEVDELSETERAEKGFGSTGVK